MAEVANAPAEPGLHHSRLDGALLCSSSSLSLLPPGPPQISFILELDLIQFHFESNFGSISFYFVSQNSSNKVQV